MRLRANGLSGTKDRPGCSYRPKWATRRLNATLRDVSEITPLSSRHLTPLEAAVPVVEAVRMAVFALLLATPRADVAQRGAAAGASGDEAEGEEQEQRAVDPSLPAHGEVKIRRT